MPTYFSLYSPKCCPYSCSRKALSSVPSGGQWWERKIHTLLRERKKKTKPKPKLCFEFTPACEANSDGPKHLLYLLTDLCSTQSSTAQHHLCQIKRQGFKWKKNIWGGSPLKLQIQFKVTRIKQSYQCFRQKSLNESCFLNHHVLGMLRELWVRF